MTGFVQGIRVIAFAEVERKSGRSWADISKELGVAFETVRRWCIATGAVGRDLPAEKWT
jgi:hypothetical protein